MNRNKSEKGKDTRRPATLGFQACKWATRIQHFYEPDVISRPKCG